MTDSSTAARQAFLQFDDLIPGSAEDAMYLVGAVEVVAGLVVLALPRYGSLLVASWLGGIIVNLLLAGGYGDIALRDFGLMLGALTLARLAWSEAGGTAPARSRRVAGGQAQSVGS